MAQAWFASTGLRNMVQNLDLRGNTVLADSITTTTLNTSAGGTFTGVVNANTAGVRTKQAVNNVHDTAPTIAELTISFGDPATLGRGFIGTIDDNDADAISYIVWVSDASFYFVKGTKASA